MDEQIKMSIHRLVQKSLDGEITASESESLNEYVSNPAYTGHYLKCLRLCHYLRDKAYYYEISESLPADMDTFGLELLAHHEKIAPAVDLKDKAPQQEVIQKVIYEKQPRQISRFTIFSGFISSAAILLVILFIKFLPERYSIDVATLVDQIDVKWAGSNVSFANGDRLWTNQMPIGLDKGIIKIQYDDGVELLVEGPAKFTVERSGVYCEYGRLFSRVSESGLGFLVETPTSRFVDMGTEFGVQADVDGSSALHVIKGKVQVFAGPKEKAKSSHIVTENQAMRYNATNSLVREIPVQRESFVRSIDSKTNTVWRGQMQIDLADIVGGGNGLGTGRPGACIDTTTGQWKPESYLPARSGAAQPGVNMECNYLLHPVKTNPFIDGVFIPDNDQGPVAVSTQGHQFDEFPDTSGLGWGGILSIEDRILNKVIQLNNEPYGIPGKPALFMHGNAGITFDLDRIRGSFSGAVKEFMATYGISDNYVNGGAGCPPYADFWVLVDGQVRFCKKGVLIHQGGSISVVLSEEDRFLSLVTTDGGQGTPDFEHRTSVNDWSLFGRPVLLTE